MTPKELAVIAVKALDEKKGKEISAIEVTEQTTLADYFVIASGSSNTQINALCGAVEKAMKEQAGLDSLECYYPEHTPEMVRNYLDLAHRYDLHVSAGSDFHGEKVHADWPLCPVSVEIEWLLAEK